MVHDLFIPTSPPVKWADMYILTVLEIMHSYHVEKGMQNLTFPLLPGLSKTCQ